MLARNVQGHPQRTTGACGFCVRLLESVRLIAIGYAALCAVVLELNRLHGGSQYAVGGKLIGGWYAFGEYDIVLIVEAPDNVSMAAVGMAVAAGGAMKSAKTTVLMTGEEGVAAMQKASSVSYAPKK